MQTISINSKAKDVSVDLTEDTEVKGLYVITGNEEVKITGRFKHSIPNIKSHIQIKAVVYDSASFDFEGILDIPKGSFGTNTYLSIKCLLVGEKASASAVPSLEILEDEVKAGHGATVGYLDQQQMQYLQSKGLSSEEAEKTLIEAFISS